MKFGIDIGHNCPPDTGAVGLRKEDDLTKEVGTLVMQKLAAKGHSIVYCTPNTCTSVGDSLRKRVNKANANQVDIFVSIHFNAFNGRAHGSEVFAISNAARGIAKPVLKEIVKLGFTDRGVKNTGFYVLKNTSMPAILIECCFCDSSTDMNRFEAEKMADAITVGLIDETGDPGSLQPGTLRIQEKTILKPSTEQSSELPPETLVDIEPGDYPVLDFRYEERHYWVKWPNKTHANRDIHFVFDEVAEVIAT